MNEFLQYNKSKIHFGSVGHDFNQLLESKYKNTRKVILTDERVFGHWAERMVTDFQELSKADIVQFPEGEAYKTIEVCSQIWAALSEYEIGRNDLIINLGGGVVTDLGGFVASLYKRGLHFINIPTTLLAQVDASVGGKTAVDLGPYKNQIGLFSDPDHVFIDANFLSTLEDEQIISGFAEMLKHGLIADESYWKKLIEIDPLKIQHQPEFIRHSVEIKKKIVEADHKESGLRKVLNFGHSIGHGIEGYLLHQNKPTLHGYAVAWGMSAESYIACSQGLLDETSVREIRDTIAQFFPKAPIEESDFKHILQLIYNDKKNKEGRLLFSLIDKIGNAVYDQPTTDKEVLDSLKYLID